MTARTAAGPAATAAPRGEACLHDLVEAQVASQPDADAVTSGMVHLTYRQLDQRANRLARHLVGLGVGPESAVAVVAERRAETVIALLAVLKAGGGYLPLDPMAPPARVCALLQDAGVVAVVGPAWARSLVPDDGPYVGVDAGSAWETLSAEPLGQRVRPENLAYVMYTSGSAGAPKGVEVEHRHIVNSTLARTEFGRRPPGTYLLLVPMTFDACAQGIYWTLCSGGRLVIPSPQQASDVRTIVELIRFEGVTHLNTIPSLYDLLLEMRGTALASLRDVSVGGEVALPALAARHVEALPATRLYNDYGPTEATVWACAHLCHGMELGRVPIGWPVRNTWLHVVDEHLRELPDGTPGELVIGGANVARGYRRFPSGTAAAFVPDPFSAESGARLYRTGDIGRRRADGSFEFLGRWDRQVKIRGHRVELGEVESALHRVAGVREAAVLSLTDRSGQTVFVGCVVPDRPPGPDLAVVRAMLEDWLPGYMVPARLESLASLPRTGHGKVDLAALERIVGTGVSAPATAARARSQHAR